MAMGASSSARSALQRLRNSHAALAPLVLLPLLVTASTGVGYRLLRDWAGLGRDQAHLLMVIHEGEWLKPCWARRRKRFTCCSTVWACSGC